MTCINSLPLLRFSFSKLWKYRQSPHSPLLIFFHLLRHQSLPTPGREANGCCKSDELWFKCQRNVCLENPGCLNCESRLCVSCPPVWGRVSQRSSFPGLHQLIWCHLHSFCRDPWSLHHVLFSLLCCWKRTIFIHSMGEKWRLGQNKMCSCFLFFFLVEVTIVPDYSDVFLKRDLTLCTWTEVT